MNLLIPIAAAVTIGGVFVAYKIIRARTAPVYGNPEPDEQPTEEP